MVSRRKLILKSLSRIEDLPVISSVYQEIIAAIDADRDISEIAALAKQDIALSAKVLKIVNSPLYKSTGRNITDVEEGVVRLGVREFKKITISLSVVETYSTLGNRINYASFWRHSLTTAFVTINAFQYMTGKELGKKVAGELFSGALLHDIGVIILDHYFPDYYKRVLDHGVHPASKKILELEDEILEINHEEVGEIIAKKWELPEHIQAVIRYHHSIQDYSGKFEPIIRVIKVANDITVAHQQAESGSDTKATEALRQKLIAKSELYKKILESYDEEVERSKLILSSI